ncbi:zinc ribbon domain-containing protein [Hydrogenophaga sp.]|jgi:putative FmdB family regulatory protein|uniref:FmdB family zinc ribbon protein n=2 Tax=Hydrogenophaga sp. TaxID=1904254 RepID=UPI003522F2C1
MPMYEYACSDCSHEFEALVRSDTVPTCPRCQSTRLTKLLSVFATPTGSASAVLPLPSCGSCVSPGAHSGCPLALGR